MSRYFQTLLILFLLQTLVAAQRNLTDIPVPDPEIERRQLQADPEFEVNLYAANPLLAKPIQMNFDEQGRLWVASSELYPQIRPGQAANDKVLVIEDTDQDGQADKTTVFADGLLIPTGVLPGDQGCYVANSTELLHLSDRDNDGRADQRRVVLSGFGTEDTHHILHTLRWGPGGLMHMNQSIYIHSHIETPYGVRRMNGGGVWTFRPSTMELETFTLGLVNPWGTAWDRQGATFETDGAGGDGIVYVFPGFVGMTSPNAQRILKGLNPGKPKLCGLAVVGGSHLPDDWQGNLIANDFRAHRVCRYVVNQDGSGFKSKEMDELIKTRHVAFRPIDVKMGPDGAIYIADWYNPIIQHGEVDFRDERRDHVHGRIWRVTAKGRPLVPRVDMLNLPTEQLVSYLGSNEPWQRQSARTILKSKDLEDVLPALARWVDDLAADDDQNRLEALWAYQTLDVPNFNLLARVLASEQGALRAGATRVIYHWHSRLPDPIDWLAPLVADPHPRVRLEAVRALSRLSDPNACQVAMRALDLPRDSFLDFCLWKTARDLEPVWMPALRRGEIDFDGNATHLTHALQAIESSDAVPILMELLSSGQLDPQRTLNVLNVMARIGAGPQLRYVLEASLTPTIGGQSRIQLLDALVAAKRQRNVMPAGDLSFLKEYLAKDAEAAASLIKAVGAWQLSPMEKDVISIATDSSKPTKQRSAAILALSDLGGDKCKDVLDQLCRQSDPLQVEAVAAMIRLQPAKGVERLTDQLLKVEGVDPTLALQAMLTQKGASDLLVRQLAGQTITRDAAMLALRTVGSSGRNAPELDAALRDAGRVDETRWRLTAEQKNELLSDVGEIGDAARGEQVFRRANLNCQKCHAIGGAGGEVGPDLVSIGASAQPDYLLESLLEPNKKIKENYHSQIVETDDGKILTGIKLRETDTDLILRNAEDQIFTIPLQKIEDRVDGGSLMPESLMESLTRQEVIDLVRFLSELGKVGGAYTVSNQPYLRSWRVLDATSANSRMLRLRGIKHAAQADNQLDWSPCYSLVAGAMPLVDLPRNAIAPEDQRVFLQYTFETERPGQHQLQLNDTSGLLLWFNEEPLSQSEMIDLEVPVGKHRITIAVDPKQRASDLSVILVDGLDREKQTN